MTNAPTVTQFQVFLAIFIPLVSAIIAASIAWGGNKYATISHRKLIEEIKAAITTMKADSEKSFKEIRDDLSSKVGCNECGGERRQCYVERQATNGEILKQIALLMAAISNQDAKRESTKDRNHDMFVVILDKISVVEQKVASIEGSNKKLG